MECRCSLLPMREWRACSREELHNRTFYFGLAKGCTQIDFHPQKLYDASVYTDETASTTPSLDRMPQPENR
jgi:hypothetical protein